MSFWNKRRRRHPREYPEFVEDIAAAFSLGPDGDWVEVPTNDGHEEDPRAIVARSLRYAADKLEAELQYDS